MFVFNITVMCTQDIKVLKSPRTDMLHFIIIKFFKHSLKFK